MSRRKSQRDSEPGLFDLPLDGPAVPGERDAEAARETGRRAPGRARTGERPREGTGAPARAPRLPLDEPEEPGRPGEASPAEVETAAAPAGRVPVPLSARFLAGLADLAVHLGLAVALLFGARLLGVPAGLGDGPALVLFLLIFSFLYTVVPLAFWGQTPGMAWAGLVARTPTGETLTFRQTALRWLGGILTVLLLALPVLPAAGGGRSLADRLSGTVTRTA